MITYQLKSVELAIWITMRMTPAQRRKRNTEDLSRVIARLILHGAQWRADGNVGDGNEMKYIANELGFVAECRGNYWDISTQDGGFSFDIPTTISLHPITGKAIR